ncbi:hypothetical protein D3C76_1760300 [compost metagenome]
MTSGGQEWPEIVIHFRVLFTFDDILELILFGRQLNLPIPIRLKPIFNRIEIFGVGEAKQQ